MKRYIKCSNPIIYDIESLGTYTEPVEGHEYDQYSYGPFVFSIEPEPSKSWSGSMLYKYMVQYGDQVVVDDWTGLPTYDEALKACQKAAEDFRFANF